jgi:hypothetical protein
MFAGAVTVAVVGLPEKAAATNHAGECFRKGWFNGKNFNPSLKFSEKVYIEGNTQGLTIYDPERNNIHFMFHADAERI